jgi:hypothetical protein
VLFTHTQVEVDAPGYAKRRLHVQRGAVIWALFVGDWNHTSSNAPLLLNTTDCMTGLGLTVAAVAIVIVLDEVVYSAQLAPLTFSDTRKSPVRKASDVKNTKDASRLGLPAAKVALAGRTNSRLLGTLPPPDA